MTAFSSIFELGPGCCHACPISSRRFTTFGANFPSRLGAALRIRLQWMLLRGMSHSSTTCFTDFSSASLSACFQNHPSVMVTQDSAGILISPGIFWPSFCSISLSSVEYGEEWGYGLGEVSDKSQYGLQLLAL